MPPRKSAVVLVNPRSRSGARAPIGRLLDAFTAGKWTAEVWAGEGQAWTRRAAERARDLGVDAIFGAGGDGMLAQILPVVLGTRVALGVVPLGTGNVWARELKLPLDPIGAVSAQIASEPSAVDVGEANGRPFLAIASAGFDAGIVERVEADAATKALGQAAYPLAGLLLAAELRGVAGRVFVDDDPPLHVELLAAMVTNGRLYGGLVPLVPNARIDDGLLDLVLFSGHDAFDATAHTARVLVGLHHTDRNVLIRSARRIRIETLERELPVQADGDPFGRTPLEVKVLPGALMALAPSALGRAGDHL